MFRGHRVAHAVPENGMELRYLAYVQPFLVQNRVAVEDNVLTAPMHDFDLPLLVFHALDMLDFCVIKHHVLEDLSPFRF